MRRKLPRAGKFGQQWLKTVGRMQLPATRAVFVLGAQRSGTRLPLQVLQRCPDIITYNEGSSPFFDGVLLRDDLAIARLLRRSPFPVIVLKPICESHRAHELLDTFSGSKVVWIFRDFRDTVHSAVAKWTGGRQSLKDLATGNLASASWRAGGLTKEKLDLVADLYSDDMSPHAAQAVMYYLRNSQFFDLGLAGRGDVFLVRYEDLAVAPETWFPPLFEFLGCQFQRRCLEGVYDSSVREKPFPRLPTTVERLCEQVHQDLTECYSRQHTARR